MITDYDYRLQLQIIITNYGLQITDYKLGITNYNYKLQITIINQNCKLYSLTPLRNSCRQCGLVFITIMPESQK